MSPLRRQRDFPLPSLYAPCPRIPTHTRFSSLPCLAPPSVLSPPFVSVSPLLPARRRFAFPDEMAEVVSESRCSCRSFPLLAAFNPSPLTLVRIFFLLRAYLPSVVMTVSPRAPAFQKTLHPVAFSTVPPPPLLGYQST